tara:strand:+ start:1309 stop:2178 length:870 start_codon:yes stop_codon:yes gene_type:complete
MSAFLENQSGTDLNDTQITRRGAMGRLATLLAMGAWPGLTGCLAPSGKRSPVSSIRFVVTNDFHHEEDACDPWMRALFSQVGETEGAAFCFALGDLANSGKRSSLERMRDHLRLTEVPTYTTPGNHDLDVSPVEGLYEEIFPGRRNYHFTQNGWQFVVVDTTEGTAWKDVTISPDTMAWLDENMPNLDPQAPTVLATHFPIASTVRMCPFNAEDLLERFVGFNLRGTFSGHFHGQTKAMRGEAEMVTNVCVARVRGNHDGTDFKGYWVCDGAADGTLRRTFVAFVGPIA